MSFDNFTYYRMMEESLKEIKKLDKKPTLLLHSCCAPCNAFPLVLLIEYFDLTLMYNNSNIKVKNGKRKVVKRPDNRKVDTPNSDRDW